jgi:hypothetical protein
MIRNMDIIKFLFTLSTSVKLYHWQTGSYARHKSSDELFDKVTSLTDKLLEVYQGKYGKVSSSKALNISVESFSDGGVVEFLKESIKWLQDIDKNTKITSKDTDLLNIRDELVGEINQTIYLFSFK